jgi:hypothetical protein
LDCRDGTLYIEARVLEIEDVMAADAMGVEEAQARLVHEEKALPPS